ncbi:MAG: hypothetical protein KatS3mg076_2049 [Candidatus Binatia bacterium]|nr:MAG: hypothetical protein KatS3mg076_2049 [Candidatus Binatia bacterium]
MWGSVGRPSWMIAGTIRAHGHDRAWPSDSPRRSGGRVRAFSVALATGGGVGTCRSNVGNDHRFRSRPRPRQSVALRFPPGEAEAAYGRFPSRWRRTALPGRERVPPGGTRSVASGGGVGTCRSNVGNDHRFRSRPRPRQSVALRFPPAKRRPRTGVFRRVGDERPCQGANAFHPEGRAPSRPGGGVGTCRSNVGNDHRFRSRPRPRQSVALRRRRGGGRRCHTRTRTRQSGSLRPHVRRAA